MLTPNALSVLEKRYFVKDDQGNVIEDWPAMRGRVASTLAAPEALWGTAEDVARWQHEFDSVLASLDFLPNSPALANAGTRTGQLAACFVQPVEDSLPDIYDAMKFQALIHQTGGGTGFSFSRLRPKDDLVGSTKGKSCGPVEFMEVFDRSTQAIKQGGMRRGANMGILRVDHPDILAFIDLKADLSRLTNFNVSVAVTNIFMEAVEAGTDYFLVNPRNGHVVGQLDARTVFKQIVHRAWSTGEPGLVFIDRMNEWNPVRWLALYEATNPCGEQPLIPWESCNLGSINLENFVLEEPDNVVRVDWPRLRRVVRIAARMQENIVEANRYVEAVPQIAEVSKATRKVGIGVMGFARMLYKLGIAYGSPESLDMARQVMSFIDFEAKVESVELAKQRGWFPAALGHEDEYLEFFGRLASKRQVEPGKHAACDYSSLFQEVARYGIRNSNNTTVAPTGTLSIIADTSGGCEPVYALAFKRYQADTHMIDTDPVFRKALLANFTADVAEEIFRRVDAAGGSLISLLKEESALAGLPAVAGPILTGLAQVFVTAHDVSPEQHVDIQAAFQAFNDSAISKTINFEEDATEEDVAKSYLRAWANGCKGVTVYRNGSREWQPLSTSTTKGAAKEGNVLEAPCGCEKPAIHKSEGCTECKSCGWSACSIPGQS